MPFALYPDLMNIYADRGNLMLLQRRCEWREIAFELSGSSLGEPLDGGAHDIYYIGGGQDRDQRLCAEDLHERKRSALHEAAGRGAIVLGVCGGYQLLGNSYALGEETLPGVGLLDVRTVREPGRRLIGNVAIEVDLDGGKRSARGLREPRRAHLLGLQRRAARPGAERPRQRRSQRLRGRARRQRDRHLPARPPIAQERLVRRLADSDCARRRHRRARAARRQVEEGAHGSASRAAGLASA